MGNRTIEDLTAALDEAISDLTAARAEANSARNASDLYDVLTHVTNALHEVVEAEARTVGVWTSWGATWQEVGDFYGTSRQAQWERFTRAETA